ncbi:MAG: dihydroneopterin aldolase [Alphaproteobacteria bacterium]|nr:dihydroneopterin aldolase [Alphaproteobacteria bacterium]
MSNIFQRVTSSNAGQVVAFDQVQASPQIITESQKILIHDYQLDMLIGVWDHEKEVRQRVIINADITVEPNQNWQQDDFRHVLSYMDIIDEIESITQTGHINLLETFANKIVEACFAHKSVQEVSLKIEKPEILKEKGRVGVQLTKKRA